MDKEGYLASLIPGKVYKVLADARAAKDGMVRVVDESGEDYSFDRSHFVFVSFPQAVRRKILALQMNEQGPEAAVDTKCIREFHAISTISRHYRGGVRLPFV